MQERAQRAQQRIEVVKENGQYVIRKLERELSNNDILVIEGREEVVESPIYQGIGPNVPVEIGTLRRVSPEVIHRDVYLVQKEEQRGQRRMDLQNSDDFDVRDGRWYDIFDKILREAKK